MTPKLPPNDIYVRSIQALLEKNQGRKQRAAITRIPFSPAALTSRTIFDLSVFELGVFIRHFGALLQTSRIKEYKTLNEVIAKLNKLVITLRLTQKKDDGLRWVIQLFGKSKLNKLQALIETQAAKAAEEESVKLPTAAPKKAKTTKPEKRKPTKRNK